MGPDSHTRNVLIVDDDDDIRSLIRYWLSDDPRCGMTWEATDPLTAAGLAALLPVDVVIIDFVLCNGTASGCLTRLRESRPDARIIVYTDNIGVAEGVHVLQQGADHLVEKVTVVVEDVVSVAFGGRAGGVTAVEQIPEQAGLTETEPAAARRTPVRWLTDPASASGTALSTPSKAWIR